MNDASLVSQPQTSPVTRAKFQASVGWLRAKVLGTDVSGSLAGVFLNNGNVSPAVSEWLSSGIPYCQLLGIDRGAGEDPRGRQQRFIQFLGSAGVEVSSTITAQRLARTPISLVEHRAVKDSLIGLWIHACLRLDLLVSSIPHLPSMGPDPAGRLDLALLSRIETNGVSSPGQVPCRVDADSQGLAKMVDVDALCQLVRRYCPHLPHADFGTGICKERRIESFLNFAWDHLHLRCFLSVQDFLEPSEELKTDYMVFLAELFWSLESGNAPCQREGWGHPKEEDATLRMFCTMKPPRSQTPIIGSSSVSCSAPVRLGEDTVPPETLCASEDQAPEGTLAVESLDLRPPCELAASRRPLARPKDAKLALQARKELRNSYIVCQGHLTLESGKARGLPVVSSWRAQEEGGGGPHPHNTARRPETTCGLWEDPEGPNAPGQGAQEDPEGPNAPGQGAQEDPEGPNAPGQGAQEDPEGPNAPGQGTTISRRFTYIIKKNRGTEANGALPPAVATPGSEGNGALPHVASLSGSEANGALPPAAPVSGSEGNGALPPAAPVSGSEGNGALPPAAPVSGSEGKGPVSNATVQMTSFVERKQLKARGRRWSRAGGHPAEAQQDPGGWEGQSRGGSSPEAFQLRKLLEEKRREIRAQIRAMEALSARQWQTLGRRAFRGLMREQEVGAEGQAAAGNGAGCEEGGGPGRGPVPSEASNYHSTMGKLSGSLIAVQDELEHLAVREPPRPDLEHNQGPEQREIGDPSAGRLRGAGGGPGRASQSPCGRHSDRLEAGTPAGRHPPGTDTGGAQEPEETSGNVGERNPPENHAGAAEQSQAETQTRRRSQFLHRQQLRAEQVKLRHRQQKTALGQQEHCSFLR
ncbi:uncharacterized protein [Scyliorhinus torazame]|uniref:uncharacterized protein n=1 Tax=Scyliorhinus torazame TaxID=75743 RepID=UPI003B5CB68F